MDRMGALEELRTVAALVARVELAALTGRVG